MVYGNPGSLIRIEGICIANLPNHTTQAILDGFASN
jgi:hypothetical protein